MARGYFFCLKSPLPCALWSKEGGRGVAGGGVGPLDAGEKGVVRFEEDDVGRRLDDDAEAFSAVLVLDDRLAHGHLLTEGKERIEVGTGIGAVEVKMATAQDSALAR